jgi:hypothetical protein
LTPSAGVRVAFTTPTQRDVAIEAVSAYVGLRERIGRSNPDTHVARYADRLFQAGFRELIERLEAAGPDRISAPAASAFRSYVEALETDDLEALLAWLSELPRVLPNVMSAVESMRTYQVRNVRDPWIGVKRAPSEAQPPIALRWSGEWRLAEQPQQVAHEVRHRRASHRTDPIREPERVCTAA